MDKYQQFYNSLSDSTVALSESKTSPKKVNIGTAKYPYMVKQTTGGKVVGYAGPKEDDTVFHDGIDWGYTGKSGKNIKTGKPSHEYKRNEQGTDIRMWIDGDGKITMD